MSPRLPALVTLSLLVVACGSGGTGQGSAPTTAVAPGSTTTAPSPTSEPSGTPQAAPRWETVSTFSGTGPFQTPEFDVLPEAIQWRVRWSCETGRLRVASVPPPRRPGPLVDATCPGQADGYAIQTGRVRLEIEASGPWKAIVDQQVDKPLDEPAPPELGSARVAAEGPFYPLEKDGRGAARLHHLADGRRVLRFEGFEVTGNTDLFIWLSEAARPRTSAEAQAAPKVSIGNLKSTVGNQNYEIPADIPTERIRSIVIWCAPIAVAYSAAALDG